MALYSPRHVFVRADWFAARSWLKSWRVHVLAAAILAVGLAAALLWEWRVFLIMVAIVPCATLGMLALSPKKARESLSEEQQRFPPRSEWEIRLATNFGDTDAISRKRETSSKRPASRSGDADRLGD